MKIGIDARFYGEAGPGRYVKAIIQHLEMIDDKNEYVIFSNKLGFEEYTPKNKNFKKKLANYSWYSFDEQTRYLAAILKAKLDLYYVPHFNFPILYPKKLVTAIPDMIMHTYTSEKGTTLPVWYFRLKRFVYRFVFWWTVFRSYKVIVPSDSVLKDFVTHIKYISKEKYVRAYEGVDPDLLKPVDNPEKVLEKYGVKQPYLLHVSSMYEHKNIEGLLEMYKILEDKYGFNGQFVFVCKKDKFSERVYKDIVEKGLEDKIIIPAFVKEVPEKQKIVVTDEELTAFRMKASAYVFASFSEGFSLTTLEGMAHGLPAAISNIPVHKEIHEDAVLYFDPKNPEDMAEKVNIILTDDGVREDLKRKGNALLEKYSWVKTAKITLDVFEEALGGRN